MGHKVHPKVFRIGNRANWSSKWFSRRDFAKLLHQDVLIKKFLKKELKDASVANIEIERSAAATTVVIHSAKPGVIIGRGGQGVEELKNKIKKFLDYKMNLNINIKEVSDPSVSAELVVQAMIADIEKRMPYRRIMKQVISRVEKANAKGVKVMVSGRLNGAEIARTEMLSSGSLPLHTLRADIDYARGVARTTYGAIGVKAWIYRGEVFEKDAEKVAVTNSNKK
ncbi:MAG: 30S ribosomal protein S3 [Patescibacteria group bacterium]|nr:30S ribosomal protein S3 [Patescibacteria group bacterium]